MHRNAASQPDRAIIAAIACAAMFLALAHPPWPSWPLAAIDAQVLQALQSGRFSAADAIFGAVSRLGDAWVIGAGTSVAVVALVATGRVRDAGMLLVCVAMSGYVATELKQVYERARPLAPYSLTSFPSSHAALAMALYVSSAHLAAMRLHGRARRGFLVAGGIVLALLVGFSRLYLGAHWVSDVVAGHSIGACAALLLVAMRRASVP